jgi:hypothetical protein
MSERWNEGDCEADCYDGESAEDEYGSGAGLEDGDLGGAEEMDYHRLCEEAVRGWRLLSFV